MNYDAIIQTLNTQWEKLTIAVLSLVIYIISPTTFICLIVLCATIYFIPSNLNFPILQELQTYLASLFGNRVTNQHNIMLEERLNEVGLLDVIREENEEVFPIFQILGKSEQPLLFDEHKYPIIYTSKLQNFRTEKIDNSMNFLEIFEVAGRAMPHNLEVHLFGKVANNTVDVKMNRFCVKRTDTARLWYLLNRATELIPDNVKYIWIEDSTTEEQDTYLTNALNSVVESGIESDNMLPSQSMLYLDENVWRFSDERDADVYYIYYQIKNLSSLRSLMDGDRQNNIDTNSLKYKRYLYKLAKYIQQLHHNGIVYGYVALRNVVISPEGTDGSSIFLQSESFFYIEEQFKGNFPEIGDKKFKKDQECIARTRKKYFDSEQRNNPCDFDKSTDVFAFGLCLMELLCGRYVKPNEFTELQACWGEFGSLLERILVPRNQRESIDYVVKYFDDMSFQ